MHRTLSLRFAARSYLQPTGAPDEEASENPGARVPGAS